MTRKDYVRAAAIVRTYYQQAGTNPRMLGAADCIKEAFTNFFRSESNFDVTRFESACEAK